MRTRKRKDLKYILNNARQRAKPKNIENPRTVVVMFPRYITNQRTTRKTPERI